ncbi:MAG: T9SS type A sorting domain-containing protein [Bacteroidales bacterium]|nr:T9SS type A sorting domain-containing protein [Bacteroidales bacterium]
MVLKISTILFLFIGGAIPTRNMAQTFSNQSSPFGITTLSTTSNTISFANEVGAKSVRLAGPQAIVWDRVKSQGWSENDKIINDLYNSGFEISVVVLGGNPVASGNLDEYSKFISEMAERYNGDGINDASGSPIVTYFEIDNEPDLYEPNENSDWHGNLSETKDYALVLKTAYEAIKSTSPNAKVAIAGEAFAAQNSKVYYDSILTELDKLKTNGDDRYFDVYNFHYYGFYYEYLANQISDVKSLLSKHGCSNVEIIVTETATYSGTSMFGGISNNMPYQSEEQQAESLVKRYVYSKANGIDKIYWYMQHAENGLSSSSGSKLLAYYSFKKMTDILEGSEWTNIVKIREDTVNNIFIYKFTKNGNPIYAAWWDYFNSIGYNSGDSMVVTISGLSSIAVMVIQAVPKYTSGINITDYNAAFVKNTENVQNSSVTFYIKEKPVFVEELNTTSIDEMKGGNSVKVYPNPSNSTINLQLPENNCQIKIFDVMGNLVFEKTLHSKQETLTLNLPKGMYFCQIINEQKIISVKKIIIQ